MEEITKTEAYTSIDDVASLVHNLGLGCLLAKLDLQEAYQAILVLSGREMEGHTICGQSSPLRRVISTQKSFICN